MPNFSWEDNIFGMIRPDEWLNVGRIISRPNDPISGLFADEKTTNISAKWQSISSQYNIPTMAYFHAFDTEAETTYRIPVDTHNAEKGLIKVKLNQSERLRELTRNGLQNEELYRAVLGDGINLSDQVVTRTYVAKNEILATGQFTIKENNLSLTVDYGVPSVNKSLTIDTAGDIPAQIEDIIETARTNGVILNGFVTSNKLWREIRDNATLQKLANSTVNVGARLTNAQARDFLASEYGLTNIIIQDLTYNIFGGYGTNARPTLTSHRYYPEDKITFFATNPAGRLGIGLWGDPPEVDLSVQSDAAVSGSALSPYVYVTQWRTKDPVETWTKASTLFLPVLYDPNSIYIATKTEDNSGD